MRPPFALAAACVLLAAACSLGISESEVQSSGSGGSGANGPGPGSGSGSGAGSCVPVCLPGACGDDGCDGSCGGCGATEGCVDSVCVDCTGVWAVAPTGVRDVTRLALDDTTLYASGKNGDGGWIGRFDTCAGHLTAADVAGPLAASDETAAVAVSPSYALLIGSEGMQEPFIGGLDRKAGGTWVQAPAGSGQGALDALLDVAAMDDGDLFAVGALATGKPWFVQAPGDGRSFCEFPDAEDGQATAIVVDGAQVLVASRRGTGKLRLAAYDDGCRTKPPCGACGAAKTSADEAIGTEATAHAIVVVGGKGYVVGTQKPTPTTTAGFVARFDLTSFNREATLTFTSPPASTGDALFTAATDGFGVFVGGAFNAPDEDLSNATGVVISVDPSFPDGATTASLVAPQALRVVRGLAADAQHLYVGGATSAGHGVVARCTKKAVCPNP